MTDPTPTTSGADAKAFWQGLLTACRAQMQGVATRNQQMMMFQGRQLQRYTPSEVIALHDRAAREVKRFEDIDAAAARAGAGLRPRKSKVLTRFWR